MKNEFRNKAVKLEVLCMGFGQRSIDDLRKYLEEHSKTITLSNNRSAKKSDVYGLRTSNYQECVFPANKKIKFFRISHGMALDGIETFFEDGSKVNFGNLKSHYSDFKLDKDEYLTGISFRAGAWVDSVQFITNKRTSPNFGGNGGGLHRVPLLPRQYLLGFYGQFGDWCDQIGIFYG